MLMIQKLSGINQYFFVITMQWVKVQCIIVVWYSWACTICKLCCTICKLCCTICKLCCTICWWPKLHNLLTYYRIANCTAA